MNNSTVLLQTDCPDLNLVHRGKVRDLYEIDKDHLLMVATDRISAYDKVMKEGIPNKGRILTRTTLFWLGFSSKIIPNHLVTADINEYPPECAPYYDQLAGRSMLVRKVTPLPVECIVRGYLSGSYWKAYQKNTTVCGFALPTGMKESEKFPQPLFTASTKAAAGAHDENIPFEEMVKLMGGHKGLAEKARDLCLALYEKAAAYALARGIIIADTKFELGWDGDKLILIDEVLTPDSSRFWPVDRYQPGQGQPSFDKQGLRDYLTSVGYSGDGEPPTLPQEVINKTARQYELALGYITEDGL